MTVQEAYKKIDAIKVQFEKLKPLKPEDEERLWKKFRLDWNYNSNHMEGNTLTYGHTELLLVFDKVTGDYSGREIEEMKAHDVAIKLVQELADDKERNLTESFIRQLNKILLVRTFWKEAITPDGQPTRREIHPGEYKEFPNSVRLENGEIFNYASPAETPSLMSDLMVFYNENILDKSVNPVWLAAMFHYKFICIHPFDDGNGRVARLLMNYILLKYNFPPVIIKSDEKKGYLTALNKADTGDLEAFVIYICEQVNWSFELSIKAGRGEKIDELGDLDKKILQLKRKLNTNDNERIKVYKDADSMHLVLEKSLIPLMEKINERLSEFEIFFNSKNEELTKGADRLSDSFHHDIVILQRLISEGSDKIYNIDFNYSLNGFRKSTNNVKFNIKVIVEFFFHKNVYEIKSMDIDKTYSLLYHEYLTAEELEIIAENIGNNVLNEIEEKINKQ